MKIVNRRAIDAATRKPRKSRQKGAKLVYLSIFLILCFWWYFLYSTNGALMFNHFLVMKYNQALHATNDAFDSTASSLSEGSFISEQVQETFAASFGGLTAVAPLK